MEYGHPAGHPSSVVECVLFRCLSQSGRHARFLVPPSLPPSVRCFPAIRSGVLSLLPPLALVLRFLTRSSWVLLFFPSSQPSFLAIAATRLHGMAGLPSPHLSGPKAPDPKRQTSTQTPNPKPQHYPRSTRGMRGQAEAEREQAQLRAERAEEDNAALRRLRDRWTLHALRLSDACAFCVPDALCLLCLMLGVF